VAKARRGRKVKRQQRPPAPTSEREHWRADGLPKTRFATRDDANRSSLYHRLESGRDLDPYRCRICDGWHLGTARE
jgi:hypothetical protein